MTDHYESRMQAQGALARSSCSSVNDRRLHLAIEDSTVPNVDVRQPSGIVEKFIRLIVSRRISGNERAACGSTGRAGNVRVSVLLSAIFLVTATLAIAQRAVQKSSVEQAWDLVARDKRSDAIALMRDEISKHPNNAEARLLLGSLLVEAGDTAGAMLHLREGVRLRPRSSMARNALGEALADVGDPQAARAEFETAVTLDPGFAPARENLGRILLQTEDLAGAAKQLDQAIRLYGPKEAGAYARYLRARVHTSSGEWERADAELQRVVALRPEMAEAWSDLGQVREKLDDQQGAVAALERSLQINPAGAVAHTRLGSLYLRLGRATDAVPHLEKAVQLMPGDHTALNSLQRALREAGEPEKADQVRSRLTELIRKRDRDSQNALTAVNLNNEGAELEKQGKLVEAVQKYAAALGVNPGHAGIRVNYAIALLRLGRWERGLAELRTAVQQDPSNKAFRKALDDALIQAPAALREPN